MTKIDGRHTAFELDEPEVHFQDEKSFGTGERRKRKKSDKGKITAEMKCYFCILPAFLGVHLGKTPSHLEKSPSLLYPSSSVFWGCILGKSLLMKTMSGERCHPSEHRISKRCWDKIPGSSSHILT